MKKILYFTITYICIGLFLIFLPNLDINFWLWLSIGITLLILPIIGVKILKNNYNISKEALIATSFVLLLSILIGTFKFFEPPQDILIAMTKSPQKASQIQELLTTQKQETIRRYVYGENNNPTKIGIFIPRTSKTDFANATLQILTSKILDKDVDLTIPTKHTTNRKQLINNAEKDIANFFKNIDGVTNAYIAIKINDYNLTPIEINEVIVKLKMAENADKVKIEKLIKLYLTHTLPNVKPEQIHIDILQEN